MLQPLLTQSLLTNFINYKEQCMSQTKFDVKISDKDKADEIVKKTENVQGVKFVNVNLDNCIVVTHGDDFDEAAFKSAAGI